MRTLLFVLFTIALAITVQARFIQSLTFQEAYDQADLVVVARPVSVTDLAERISLPNLGHGINGVEFSFPEAERAKVMAIGVETVFTVERVVKGEEPAGNRFVLHHYRLPTPVPRMRGAPELVTFDPTQPRSYLLLLKKEADGRFAPVSGQIDPAFGAIVSADRFDVIVIGNPVSTEVKTETITVPNQLPIEETIRYEAQFAVQQLLWGSTTMSEFPFRYYWRPSGSPPYKFAPNQTYLLVLKKDSDGRFMSSLNCWGMSEYPEWGVARVPSPPK